MFDAVISILKNYLSNIQFNRFSILNIEALRGDNPEDVFYICDTLVGRYVIYETDYIGALAVVKSEVAEIVQLAEPHVTMLTQNPPINKNGFYKYIVFKID